MRCENCKININNLSSNCPLCGRHLPECDAEKYPSYPDITESASVANNKNIRGLLFLTIVFSLSAFLLNLLTPYKYFWSMIPISGMWLLWLVLGIPIIKKRITPSMIVLDNIIVSVFLNIIDITLNQQGWAMSYVVPFILMGSALAITIVFMLTKIDWKEYYPSQMAIVGLCFIPLTIRIFISFIFWPSVISAAYGFVTILGMVILGNKKFKHETKKRFHL